jgi:ferredoxin
MSGVYAVTRPEEIAARLRAAVESAKWQVIEGECSKCGFHSGDDWMQCRGVCPVPGSPHYVAGAQRVAVKVLTPDLSWLLAERDRLRGEVERLTAERDAAYARGVEDAARVADEYATVNLEMAGDTVLHDPVLSGRDRSDQGFAKSAEMQVDGTIHSAAYHAATNIAASIRALAPGGAT